MSFCHHIAGVTCPNCKRTYYTEAEVMHSGNREFQLEKDIRELKKHIRMLDEYANDLMCYRDGTTTHDRAKEGVKRLRREFNE